MTHFKIDLTSIKAGLSHQISNFKIIITYCFMNNLKLVKPIFILTSNHNNNNELKSDLSKYYDLNNITVDGNLFKLYDDVNYSYTIKKKSYKHHLVRNDPIFQNLKKLNIVIPYKKDIIDIANKVSLKLDEYLCIHVRRGDRITNKQIDIDTQPNNIVKIINKYEPKNTYIMTNRLNELKSLSNMKNIYFYTDFSFLQEIDDNYYLFCIENNIMEFSKIRCSTFNTNLNDSSQNYYHCYLTDHPGWQ